MSPDLVLLLVVSWVLLHGMREGLAVALLGGLVLDALSAGPFGVATLSLAVVSWIAGLGEINVFRTARLLPYVMVVPATLACGGLLVILMETTGDGVSRWPMLWRVVMPETIVNLACMPVVYGVARWLSNRMRPQPVEWQ